MNRKTITYTISLLMALALISVGFASWIISAPTTVELEGSITTENVVDARIGLTTTWGTFVEPQAGEVATHKYDETEKKYVYADQATATHIFKADTTKNNIYFGVPTISFESSDWLTNDAKEKKENLIVYLQVELSNIIQRNESDEVTSKLDDNGLALTLKEKKANDEDESKFEAASSATFKKIVNSEGTYSVTSDGTLVKGLDSLSKNIYLVSNTVDQETNYYLSLDKTYDELDIEVNEDPNTNGGKTSIIVAIEFEWGTAFNSQNPYTYYNTLKPDKYIDLNSNSQQDQGESVPDIAIENITALHTLNTVKFTLTIAGHCSQVQE